MRGLLLSVVVGLAGVGCVVALGFGLLAAVFPSPAPLNRIAADATRWLGLYRYSVDVFHSDGRRLRGACMRGWYPRPLRPDSLLMLNGGPDVLAIEDRPIRFLSVSRRRDFPALLAIRTGCTLQLGNALYEAAQGNTRISMERAYAANQPALALEMPNVLHEHITLYVSPHQYRPLVAIAGADGHTIAARIYLAPVYRSVLRRYRRLLNKRTRRHRLG